jgi:hypothetical protein
MRIANLTTTRLQVSRSEEDESVAYEPLAELELVEEVSARVLMCAGGCVDTAGD